jgi:hypothetical protein
MKAARTGSEQQEVIERFYAEVWLPMWDAAAIKHDRKSADAPTVYVPRGFVSIVGGIQPGVLARKMNKEYLDSGLGARLLLAMPQRLAHRWPAPKTSFRFTTTLIWPCPAQCSVSGAHLKSGLQ